MARNPLGGCYSARTSSTASISTRRQRPRVGPRRTPLRAAARILEARSEPGLTMTSPQRSIPFWLAHSSLQLALRLWPEESRDWGHAIAAELDEIENFISKGSTLYPQLLARLRSLLHRPVLAILHLCTYHPGSLRRRARIPSVQARVNLTILFA